MRVKIGNQWFSCGHMQPIMVELTEEEKRIIANLPPDQNRFAEFSRLDLTSQRDKDIWISE